LYLYPGILLGLIKILIFIYFSNYASFGTLQQFFREIIFEIIFMINNIFQFVLTFLKAAGDPSGQSIISYLPSVELTYTFYFVKICSQYARS